MKVLPGISTATPLYSTPEFLSKASGIVTDLEKMKLADLSSLMKISDKLALLNYDRYQNWNKKHNIQNASPAILSFKGEAYRGLNAAGLSVADLEYAQKVLCVLSGLYGVLRPLDLIQEYRLEMGTRHGFCGKKNLYELWKSTITTAINEAIENTPGDKVLINVASNEYAKAIDLKKLKHEVIVPSFYQENEGKLKMVTVYAKKARGMMARFIIENRIETLTDLKAFDLDGYFFDNNRSTKYNLVFVR